MIKLVLELNSIEYDAYLEEILKRAAENPELTGGIKLPRGTAAVIKHLPKKAKNEMIAKAVNSHSEAAIPRVEQLLAGVLGPVKIKSFQIVCGSLSKESVVMNMEIARFDGDMYVDSFLPRYYSEETAARIFEGYTLSSYHLEDAQQFIRSREGKEKELLIAKSISSNKEYITGKIAEAVRRRGMDMDIRSLRVLVR